MDLNPVVLATSTAAAAGFGSAVGALVAAALTAPTPSVTVVMSKSDLDDLPASFADDDEVVDVVAHRWAESRGHPEAATLIGNKIRAGRQVRGRRRRRW